MEDEEEEEGEGEQEQEQVDERERAASSATTHTKTASNRKVSFTSCVVYCHERVIAAEAVVSSGLPLGLGWECVETQTKSVDAMEEQKQKLQQERDCPEDCSDDEELEPFKYDLDGRCST